MLGKEDWQILCIARVFHSTMPCIQQIPCNSCPLIVLVLDQGQLGGNSMCCIIYLSAWTEAAKESLSFKLPAWGTLVPSLTVGIWALISRNAGSTSFKDILKISYLILRDVSGKPFIGLFSLYTDLASTEIMDLGSVLFLCIITLIKIVFIVHKANMLKRITPWLAVVFLELMLAWDLPKSLTGWIGRLDEAPSGDDE